MKTPTILVVEDEGIIARDLRVQLTRLGYDVVGNSPTGEEALVLAREYKPDLVLMDIHLAGAMDGIEAGEAIRKELGTAVVFLTAFAGTEVIERAKRVEPFGYIIKPFDERQLHTIIEMALYKHRAETRLRRAYEEQATVLRTAIDAFILADWQGRLLDVNEATCEMFGYTREELLGLSLKDLDPTSAHPAANGLDHMKQAARFERFQRRKDGSQICVEMSVNYLAHSGGRIFCFVRDITKREETKAALVKLNEDLETRVADRTAEIDAARREAERANRAKADFLAAMTHALRTPLSGLIGTVDVLKSTALETHQVEMLDMAAESAQSLLSIVDSILDFSKTEAGQMGVEIAPLSIEEVVQKSCATVRSLADKANVELTLFTDPRLPSHLLGDQARLTQVLVNLLGNAVKFSGGQTSSGQVSVRAVFKEQVGPDAHFEIEVRDNGVGMDTLTASRAFDAFNQGDPAVGQRLGGMGLGLALVKNLISLMGGTITVTSAPNQGARFVIGLSLAIGDGGSQESTPSDVAGVSCLTIGPVDGLQSDLAAYLEHAGAAVDHVLDLKTARVRVESNPRGPWVWIFDIQGEAPTLESLRKVAQERPGQDTRFVLIGRGRRRTPRPVAPGVVVVDANELSRTVFLSAVAAAAGRIALPTVTRPIPVRRPVVAAPSREAARNQRRLVLIADDNEISRRLIGRQLELLGFASDTASDGRVALEMWRTGDYCLLLTDLDLAGLDGYQLTAAIRVQEPTEGHSVIVALTTDRVPGGTQQCRDAGLDDYLLKPSRLSDLKAILAKWIPRHDGPNASPGRSIGTPSDHVPSSGSSRVARILELN